ncbi:hypothetical protein AMECASPLE_039213 [Ameca splendens]|uniref:Uncharacterized protein n=1 Tax=Ameca splendens TaxID=208324 RepID=A0ABV0Z811_9TELE
MSGRGARQLSWNLKKKFLKEQKEEQGQITFTLIQKRRQKLLVPKDDLQNYLRLIFLDQYLKHPCGSQVEFFIATRSKLSHL